LAEGTIERPPEFLRREAPQEPGDAVLAELFLETHHVSGIVGQADTQRRLVDLLNTAEVTGQIHLPSGADPGSVPLLGRRDFLPVTGAVVTQAAFANVRWEQPLVVVNLDRAVLFVPGLA